MGRTVHPNPANASRAELETAARCAPKQRTSERLRAIIALIMGLEPAVVAEIYGVQVRTVRRWVRAFNDSGIDGLIDKPRPGRPRKISPEQAAQCRQVLDEPAQVGRDHWTGVKFHGYLRETLQIEVGYATVVRFLHEQNYRLKVPQPWPDRQDEAQREAFRQCLGALLADPTVEVWFGDECGVEGDPRPRRRWAKRGEKTRGTRNGEHVRMNVTGIVCPRTGDFYALEFSHSDSVTFQTFLDHANQDLFLERKRQVLIVDNASWHKLKSLRWGRFEPLFLPAYSPDLNPIERLWLVLKAEWFVDFTAKTREDLLERLDLALRWLTDRNQTNQRTCAVRT